MKYLWLILLPSFLFADCNSGGYSCSVSSDCPISGTIYLGTWYSPCGTGFCEPSSCHWHQPTYSCPDTQVWAGTCTLGMCNATRTISAIGCTACGAVADCVNTIAFCSLGACPAWSAWSNDGCGPVDGCAIGLMGQSATGSGAACCGPTIKHQCVASGLCSAPTITAFTALPTTVELGSPITLSWTLAGGPPTSMTIDNGVGPVVGTSVSATPGSVGTLTYILTVSNALGPATASVLVTVTPPVPRCGVGKICGHVYAFERPTQALPQMNVSLYKATGEWTRGALTNGSGRYEFNVPTGTYYVRAEPDRTWQDVPDSYKTTTNNVIGAVDFKMRGVPAIVTVIAPADTFVLFTTAPLSGLVPPDIPSGTWTFTAVTDLNNQRAVNIKGGFDWWMTCWKWNTTAWPYVEEKGANVHINAGATLWPLDQISEVCP